MDNAVIICLDGNIINTRTCDSRDIKITDIDVYYLND